MLKSTLAACLQDFWAQEVQKLNQNHYFTRRGEATPPSHPNKDRRWILDLPSVLKWSTSARFGSFSRTHAEQETQPSFRKNWTCICLPSALPTGYRSTVAGMFLLPNGRQQLMYPWCNPRIKRVSVLALAQLRGLFTQYLFTRLFNLITCEHDSGAHVHRGRVHRQIWRRTVGSYIE